MSCSTRWSYSTSFIFGVSFANTSTITTAIASTLVFETPRDGGQLSRVPRQMLESLVYLGLEAFIIVTRGVRLRNRSDS